MAEKINHREEKRLPVWRKLEPARLPMAVGRCCAPGFAAGAPEFAVGRRVAGMKLVVEDDDGRCGSVARKVVAARLLRGSTTSETEEKCCRKLAGTGCVGGGMSRGRKQPAGIPFSRQQQSA